MLNLAAAPFGARKFRQEKLKKPNGAKFSCGGGGCEMAIPEPKIIIGFGALKKGGTFFFFPGGWGE